MKLLKYVFIEIYKNKYNIIIFLIMILISLSTIYTLTNTLYNNYSDTKVPDILEENDIVSMMMIYPEDYTEIKSSDDYQKFIDEIFEKIEDEVIFQFDSHPNISTANENFMSDEINEVYSPENKTVWQTNSLIISKNYLEKQDLNIDFLENNSLTNFEGNKVLISEMYKDDYPLGSEIKLYTPYNTNNDELVTEKTYTVVGHIQTSSEMFNPILLENFKLNNNLVLPSIYDQNINSTNPEYEEIYQNIIASTMFHIAKDDVEEITKILNNIASDSEITLLTTNNATAINMNALAYKNIFISNLKKSIPVIILFILGINYTLKTILENRMRFISLISLLGARKSFIRKIYIMLVCITFIFTTLIYILINITLLNNTLNIYITTVNSIVLLLISMYVMSRQLRVININNISRILKEKND